MKTKKRVLIVDDDPAVRDSIKFDLELEGWSVETFAGGEQLLQSGGVGGADCLVLDYRMPRMDGFAVMAALAARRAPPVILITAPVTDAIRRRARDAGVFRLLEKPLLDGVLAESVRHAMN